ncbi:glycoside hydrolase family 18 protein, partial [Apiospora marii]
MHISKSVIVAAATAAPGLAHYTKECKVNTYFGQAPLPVGETDRLSTYCKSDSIDHVTLAFVNNSPENGMGYPGTNFGAHCYATVFQKSTRKGQVPTKLLTECNDMKEDIKVCQDLGKKVYLSIGGEVTATSNYAISSVDAGIQFGQQMYDIFGPKHKGYNGPRPFGDLSVDGFDFDIETKFKDQKPYIAMIDKLRCLIRDNKCGMTLTASPQCPLDAQNFQMDSIMAKAQFDKIFIQFYNNPSCAATSKTGFNLDKWVDYIKDKPSKDAELYIGLPGSSKAAQSGYISPDKVTELICKHKYGKNFGGVSIWDAYFARKNEDCEKETYYDVVKKALKCGGCKNDVCPPKPKTTSTSSAAVTSPTSTSSSAAVTIATSASDAVTASSSATESAPTDGPATITASAS